MAFYVCLYQRSYYYNYFLIALLFAKFYTGSFPCIFYSSKCSDTSCYTQLVYILLIIEHWSLSVWWISTRLFLLLIDILGFRYKQGVNTLSVNIVIIKLTVVFHFSWTFNSTERIHILCISTQTCRKSKYNRYTYTLVINLSLNGIAGDVHNIFSALHCFSSLIARLSLEGD